LLRQLKQKNNFNTKNIELVFCTHNFLTTFLHMLLGVEKTKTESYIFKSFIISKTNTGPRRKKRVGHD